MNVDAPRADGRTGPRAGRRHAARGRGGSCRSHSLRRGPLTSSPVHCSTGSHIDRLPEPRPALRQPAAPSCTPSWSSSQLFDLPPGERTVERATALVAPQWERLVEAEPDLAALFGDDQDGSALANWINGAEELVRCYFTLEDPPRLEPAERELVETVLDSGLPDLRGYVDRVDRASATGDLRVVDYKTGKAPPVGFEQRAMFQMPVLRALVLWRLYQLVPGCSSWSTSAAAVLRF